MRAAQQLGESAFLIPRRTQQGLTDHVPVARCRFRRYLPHLLGRLSSSRAPVRRGAIAGQVDFNCCCRERRVGSIAA
jgi:hypothetical protein